MDVSLHRGDSPTATYVTIGDLTLLFSYETVVAFREGREWTVCENVWSSTTGKHMSETGVSRADRIEFHEFQARLKEALGGLG